jgi:hypothetical protein
VQNINAPVDLHDLPAPGSPVGWIDRARIYEEALDAFERGDFAEADTRLGEFLALSPGDGPARGLKARIEAERTGLETEFDPVWSLPGK